MARCSWAEEERLVALVKGCVKARQLKQVHAHILARGQSQNNFIIAKLVRSFTEVHCHHHARHIVDALHAPNVFVWTALIRGYSQLNNSCREAFLLYTLMHHRCSPQIIKPLTFTLSSLLKACSQISALHPGMQLQAHAFKYGYQTDARLQTTLIHLYTKCRRFHEARRVFDAILRQRDVQSWNTMIAAYAAAHDMEAASSLFDRMPERNSFTWVQMITAYAAVGQMGNARRLFNMATTVDKNMVVYTAMITAYANCGDVLSARSLFDEMTDRDVASWNAMISAYVHADLTDEALNLFHGMLSTTGRCRVEPNQATIATVASACARYGSPILARWIREYVNNQGSKLLNSHTVAALIDLHCKCGDLCRAYDLFRGWMHKDLICYSSMIAGFGIHGRGKDAIKVFDQLQSAGLKPDAICFISVLTACSHAGLVDVGRQYFEEMRGTYRIPPSAEHYMCIVDLLGRAGHIEEAYSLIKEEMGSFGIRPHAGVWGALLSACRIYGNVEVGEVAAGQLMELEPDNAGNYVLLSNIYARAGRWEGVGRVWAEMRRRGMRKPPGCSWVEMEGCEVRRFLTGDVCHGELQMVLEVLDWELKAHGYLPAIGEFE